MSYATLGILKTGKLIFYIKARFRDYLFTERVTNGCFKFKFNDKSLFILYNDQSVLISKDILFYLLYYYYWLIFLLVLSNMVGLTNTCKQQISNVNNQLQLQFPTAAINL